MWILIQIRGSMLLTNGSGSFYFHHWHSRCQQKTNFLQIVSAYYFLKVHLHHFSKIKSQKESQNSRNQGFSYYFCMMIEESGSGSIPLTNGSGSGRPKNMWIRWIQIRNTAFTEQFWLPWIRCPLKLVHLNCIEGNHRKGASTHRRRSWCAWPAWSRAHRWTSWTEPRCSRSPPCTGPCITGSN